MVKADDEHQRVIVLFLGGSATPTTISQCIRRADAEMTTLLPRKLRVIAIRTDSAASVHEAGQAFMEAVNKSKLCRIECWHTRELLIDVLGHCDQSPHRRATESERAKYPIDHLPLMRVTDPVARWLGLDIDDVVIEEREDAYVGQSLYYRRVST